MEIYQLMEFITTAQQLSRMTKSMKKLPTFLLRPTTHTTDSSCSSLPNRLPMAGLIDKAAELARHGREIDKLRNDLVRGETKLANANFVTRAPDHVVAKERDRVQELRAAVVKLEEQQASIERL